MTSTNNILTLISELRTKRKRFFVETSRITDRINRLKKQYFDADEEKAFTFELLEAVLADYLNQGQTKKVIKNFEVSFERLELVLANLLTEQQIQEVIEKLKEV